MRVSVNLAAPWRRMRATRDGRLGLSSASLVVALLFTVTVACRPTSSLPVLFPAPDFSLTDQDGRPFSASDLAGRVVLADFVYTTCTDICPLISGTVSQVRNELRAANLLGGKVALVSFGVDPDHDTPDVLRTYGGHYGAVSSEWRFLTGDRADVEDLLVIGFKLGRPFRGTRPDGGTELVHTGRVVLIDARGQVRAFYDGQSLDVQAVVQEIRRLAA